MKWELNNSQARQLADGSGYGPRLLKSLRPLLQTDISAEEQVLLKQLANWNGDHTLNGVAPTLFNQLVYQLTDAAMRDELGDSFFDNLLATRVLDVALRRLAAAPDSPGWDNPNTPPKETKPATQDIQINFPENIGTAIGEAVAKGVAQIPPMSVNMPKMKRTPVRGKDGMIMHTIDEPMTANY